MPRLSYFYGIAIYIYWDDHNPPHYHVTYGEHEAWILIADASLLQGSLPRRESLSRVVDDKSHSGCDGPGVFVGVG